MIKPGYYVYDNFSVVIVDLEGFHWWLDGDKYGQEYELYDSSLADNGKMIPIEKYDIKEFHKEDVGDGWIKEILDIKKELFYKDLDD